MCLSKFAEKSWFYISVLFLVGSSVGWVYYANIYHAELDVYLPHYLSKENVLSIIFNPVCELDFTNTNFRGREVGSLFNFVDANLLLFMVSLGFSVLISPVFYLLLLLVVAYTKSSLNELGVTDLTAKTLSLLLLSIPPVMLGGGLYRTNKIVAASFILVSLLTIAKLLQKERLEKGNSINFLALFLSTLIAGLADEQGLAFELIIIVYVSGSAVLAREKRYHSVFFPMVAALCLVAAYRVSIGPSIFFNINGTHPTPIGSSFTEISGVESVIKSIGLLARYTSYVFGNISPYDLWGIGFLVVLFLIVFWQSVKKIKLLKTLPLFLPILILIYVITLMTSKHPAILWREIVSYYSLPFCFFIYGVFVLKCRDSLCSGLLPDRKIRVLMVFIIILNVLSVPAYSQMILSGHLSHFRVANGFFNAVNVDESLTSTELSKIKLNQLSPGAASLDIARDGSVAIRKALEMVKP